MRYTKVLLGEFTTVKELYLYSSTEGNKKLIHNTENTATLISLSAKLVVFILPI